jgi:hypothetical protein
MQHKKGEDMNEQLKHLAQVRVLLAAAGAKEKEQ